MGASVQTKPTCTILAGTGAGCDQTGSQQLMGSRGTRWAGHEAPGAVALGSKLPRHCGMGLHTITDLLRVTNAPGSGEMAPVWCELLSRGSS